MAHFGPRAIGFLVCGGVLMIFGIAKCFEAARYLTETFKLDDYGDPALEKTVECKSKNPPPPTWAVMYHVENTADESNETCQKVADGLSVTGPGADTLRLTEDCWYQRQVIGKTFRSAARFEANWTQEVENDRTGPWECTPGKYTVTSTTEKIIVVQLMTGSGILIGGLLIIMAGYICGCGICPICCGGCCICYGLHAGLSSQPPARSAELLRGMEMQAQA